MPSNMIISQTAKQMPLNAASMRRSDVANGLSRISPMLGGRQVAKYRCGITYSELEEFASVCCTASLTASADEYDRGGYFDANLVPHYYVTDYLGSNIAVIRTDGTLVQSAPPTTHMASPTAIRRPPPTSALQAPTCRLPRQAIPPPHPRPLIPTFTATRNMSAATACASTSTAPACSFPLKHGSIAWTGYAKSIPTSPPTCSVAEIRYDTEMIRAMTTT